MTNLRPLAGPLRSAVLTGLVVLAALTVPACGSSEPKTPSPGELFGEYIDSTDVKNDPFGNGGTPEDRKANLAAHGTPQQILNGLLSAYPCDTVEDEDCPSAGSRTYQRHVLVKHEDESLELMPLYVTRRSGKAAVLTDSKGESYTGGLDDFRRHNDLLGTGDLVLTPRAITSTSGSKLVVVSGHTDTDTWHPWLIGGAVTVVVLATGGLATREVIRHRSREVV
ncbi:hypothetical protein GCM10023080_070750 [Streptomyces pseudoechinosporeus]